MRYSSLCASKRTLNREAGDTPGQQRMSRRLQLATPHQVFTKLRAAILHKRLFPANKAA